MRLLSLCAALALGFALTGIANAVTVPSIPGGQVLIKYANFDASVSYNTATTFTGTNGVANVNALPQTNFAGVAATGTGGASQQYYTNTGAAGSNGAGGNSYFHRNASAEGVGWFTDVNLTVPAAGGGVKPANLEDGWAVVRITTIYDSWNQLDLPHTVFQDGQAGTELVGILVGEQDVADGQGGNILSTGYTTIKIFAQAAGTFVDQGTGSLITGTGRTGYATYNGIGGGGSTLLWNDSGLMNTAGGNASNIGAPFDNYGLGAGVITGIAFSHTSGPTGSRMQTVSGGVAGGGIWEDGNTANGEFVNTTFVDIPLNTGPVTSNEDIASTVTGFTGATNWSFSSQDPVRATFAAQPVPEPVTMVGLFFGVAAVGGYLRRRRSA